MLCYKVLCYEVNPKFTDASMIEPIREFTSVGGKVSVLAGNKSCLFLAAYSSTAFPAAILSLNAFARKFIIFNFFSATPLDSVFGLDPESRFTSSATDASSVSL